MADQLPGDNRPAVYYDPDGTLVIRASAIGGSCMWELIAAGQGHEPGTLPSNIRRAFREGHELEGVALAHIQQHRGVTVHSAQREGSLVLAPGVICRYHPDGLGTWRKPHLDPNEHIMCDGVIEVKWLGDSLWQKAARHGVESTIAEYKWQASVMMMGEGRRKLTSWVPLLWVVGNKGLPPDPETGERPPCEDEGKIFTQTVDTPFISMSELSMRALDIQEGVEGEDILESGRPCDDPSHFPCRYLHLRPQSDPEDGTESSGSDDKGRKRIHVDDGEQARIDEIARAYLYHKGQADEHEQRRDALKAELLELCPEKATYETDRFTIPVIVQPGKEYVDWKGMPEDVKSRLKEELSKYTKRGRDSKFLRGVKGKD